jgi:hypothetical protein
VARVGPAKTATDENDVVAVDGVHLQVGKVEQTLNLNNAEGVVV